MSLISFDIVYFLLLLMVVYFIVPAKLQRVVLFFFSCWFYFSYSVYASVALFISALIAYVVAITINLVPRGKKWIAAVGIIINVLGLLGMKYTSILKYIQLPTYDMSKISFSVIVPLGISFYTLSVIGYIIDVYRGKYKAEKNFFDFILFVSYFPHILQGPIARYDQLSVQLKEKHKFDYDRVAQGMQLMIWGYVKKMIIAERAALFVDSAYANWSVAPGTILVIASILYTIQIYADFSGCVDIVRGISQILGIELIQNFRQPYFSNSINDFWRRWHISLSSWFRDYLYFPLGGNRRGIVRRWINVLIVFMVSGFWHGVGVNYIIWGGIHGLYQVIGYILKPLREKICVLARINVTSHLFGVFRVFTTFLLINFAWIFFRLSDMHTIKMILNKMMFDFTPWIFTDGTLYNYGISQNAWGVMLIFVSVLLLVDFLHEKNYKIRDCVNCMCLPIRWGICIGAIVSIFVFGVYGIGYDVNSFIYMNF